MDLDHISGSGIQIAQGQTGILCYRLQNGVYCRGSNAYAERVPDSIQTNDYLITTP